MGIPETGPAPLGLPPGLWRLGDWEGQPPPLHVSACLFLQTLSMLPTRILRLLEFVGFSGNKVTTFLLGISTCSAPGLELSWTG